MHFERKCSLSNFLGCSRPFDGLTPKWRVCMRMMARRFTRAPKREGAWVGNVATAQLVGTTPVLRELWGVQQTVSYLNGGHVTHQVTHLTIGFRPGSIASYGCLFWGVKVYDTDVTGNVVSAAVIDPSSPLGLDQEYLDWGFRTFAPVGNGTPGAHINDINIVREIRAKRRISDTQALCVVVVSTVASTGYDIGFRTFCRRSKP